MATTSKKLPDGTLEITTAGDAVITTMTRGEVLGKIAEAQTKVDHLEIDLVAAKTEVARWEARLAELSS